jgi:hypothetical protein
MRADQDLSILVLTGPGRFDTRETIYMSSTLHTVPPYRIASHKNEIQGTRLARPFGARRCDPRDCSARRGEACANRAYDPRLRRCLRIERGTRLARPFGACTAGARQTDVDPLHVEHDDRPSDQSRVLWTRAQPQLRAWKTRHKPARSPRTLSQRRPRATGSRWRPQR